MGFDSNFAANESKPGAVAPGSPGGSLFGAPPRKSKMLQNDFFSKFQDQEVRRSFVGLGFVLGFRIWFLIFFYFWKIAKSRF